MNAINEKKQFPTGIQTFSQIREGNYYYVDKTQYLLEIAKEKAVFLSRPRRFGKSLTLDTLAELFSGNKELFTGLYAEDNWDWQTTYPIIRIGFGEGEISSAEILTTEIHKQLAKNEQKYQLATGDISLLHDRFRSLIQNLAEKTKQRVVILIDEYDKPMVDNINTSAILAIRAVLRDLYSVIKGQDAYIRFSMLTGVSKFSKVNIFSGLNSLTDISMMAKYSAVCGYTQAELESVFAPELVAVDMEKMKLWYNGYNWGGESVYNPYDVLLFLQEHAYKAHWFATGSSAWLVDNLAINQLSMHDIEEHTYNDADLSKFDIDEMNPIAILFQTGYLTINKRVEYPMGIRYTLKYPNIEVQQSLNEVLLNKYLGHNYNLSTQQFKLYQYLLDKDYVKVKQLFYSLYASIPYQWYTSRNENIANYEGHYASVFYSFLTGLGSRVHCEDSTNQGRMDVWFDFQGTIYIIEFKVAENQQQLQDKGIKAIEQIKERNYADKFKAERKPIVMMGVIFGKEERNIIDFMVEVGH
ncbi:MAG: ATP-binding protein [Moraxellaceae bacterium]|nr:ATP-binding protein [Moraxellaceae bacterium]